MALFRRVAVALACGAVFAAATLPAGAASYQENPADRTTFDPYFPEQWALTTIGAPQAWTRSTGGGVDIGIIDTGIDLSHQDLAPKVAASTNCVGSGGLVAACGGSAQDDQGHGTDVAGIAAAATDNGVGIAGVAPGASLVVVKALSASGSGSVLDVDAGVEWAVQQGARVINLSLESAGSEVTLTSGPTLTNAVEYAWNHGAIPVVAAGNSTQSLFGSSGYDGVDAVIVGATGPSNEVAWYSSPLTGAKWGLVAPGGDSRGADGTASCAGSLASGCIVSTGWFPNESNAYVDDEGTSMAAPEVSGVLAMLLAEGLSPSAAVSRLMGTVKKISCGTSCAGLLDAAAAVGAPATLPTTTTSPGPPPTTVPPPPPATPADPLGPPITAAPTPTTKPATKPATHATTTTTPRATTTKPPHHPTTTRPNTDPASGVALPTTPAGTTGGGSSSHGWRDILTGVAAFAMLALGIQGLALRRRSRRVT